LRCDNTESRLLDLSLEIGLLSGKDAATLSSRQDFVDAIDTLSRKKRIFLKEKSRRMSVAEYFRFPGKGWDALRAEKGVDEDFWNLFDLEYKKLLNSIDDVGFAEAALFQVETDIRYDGYIAKQNRLLHSQEHLDNLELPNDLNYSEMKALSFEAREKLGRVRPQNLGQASRIDGVRAGDMAVLVVYLRRIKKNRSGLEGSGE